MVTRFIHKNVNEKTMLDMICQNHKIYTFKKNCKDLSASSVDFRTLNYYVHS